MEQVYQSCIREYMSGIDRTNRNYKTQEVFTPDWMVDLILAELPECNNMNSIVIDRAVGDGNFVSVVLIKKMLSYQECGVEVHTSFVIALDEIFGVDIEKENVDLCRARLLCGCTDPDIISLVNRRILIGNCLHPYRRLPLQTELDYTLMKKYFTHNIEGFEDPEPEVIPKKQKNKKQKIIKPKLVKPKKKKIVKPIL